MTTPCLSGRSLAIVLSLLVSLASLSNGENCVTYGELGEFCSGYPFYDPPYRPVSYLPESPERINVRFRLLTRDNPEEPYLLTPNTDNVNSSPYRPDKPTYFIIHGYIDQGFVKWIQEMQAEFLNHEDSNAIAVNWGAGSIALYGQATANTRVVGAEIARLVNFLVSEFGARAEDMHIFGHSLGSHIAGYAGERIPNLGRITGMDPAGPYFEHCDPMVRLDPTDANFVDAIHSDGASIFTLGLGMWTPCGHVDIYPNGGLEMPGCDDTLLESIWIDGLVNGVRNFVACNHHFAVYMAIDSINSNRPDLGYLCGSWEEFVDGKCTSCGADGGGCAHYGFKAGDYALGSTRPEQTMFWMYTRENAPYGKYHHDSKIVMHQRSSDEKGTIYVNMIGMTGQSDFIEVTSGSVDLNSGETYERMTAAEHALGDILRVEFKWIYDYDWYFPWDWPIFGDPTIELEHVSVLALETQILTRFCSPGGDLKAETTYIFFSC